jgi:hypothetical protein
MLLARSTKTIVDGAASTAEEHIAAIETARSDIGAVWQVIAPLARMTTTGDVPLSVCVLSSGS